MSAEAGRGATRISDGDEARTSSDGGGAAAVNSGADGAAAEDAGTNSDAGDAIRHNPQLQPYLSQYRNGRRAESSRIASGAMNIGPIKTSGTIGAFSRRSKA